MIKKNNKKSKKSDIAVTAVEKLANAQSAAQHAAQLFATPVSDFIPFYSHYDPNTVLTKNGELMQFIKIATNKKGLNYESGNDPQHIVREVIRKAIGTHIKTDDYSFWMHTIRKRHSIRYRGKYQEPLGSLVHERWQQINQWKYQYYNEIYITVVHHGQSASLKDTDNLKDLILPHTNRSFRNKYLEVSLKRLHKAVNAIVETIDETFEARRLTVVERVPELDDMKINQPLFYSEPMEFLGMVLNLRDEQMLLPMMDLSEALVSTRHTFGFNAMETKSENGRRRFASILSLKQYREVPADTIDRLLQAPMEFIVTQAFHFLPHESALKQYREQRNIFEISEDFYCIEASGIADMIESHTNKPTDFGHHQTTIMVMSDELKHLDGEVVKVQNAFAELGLITIREDVKLEECFWSQLPANFEFIRRRDPLNTSRIAGFARLNRYPQGTYVDNHWGDAVTIFPTMVGSPYFFNFHHQDNGHSLILDFNSFSDQFCHILTNFFMCQLRKFNPRMFIFDRNRSTDLLTEKLEGHYHYFPMLDTDQDEAQMRLNPFQMEDSPRNRNFILAWLRMMISPSVALPDEQKDMLRDAIDQVYEEPKGKRTLETLIDFIGERNADLAKAFEKWHGRGEYASLFAGSEESFDLTHSINAFDMDPIVKNSDTVLPVFSYLLHRIITNIDGRPSVIVLHDAFDLIENDFVTSRLESLMDMLQENNAMVIFTTSDPMAAIEKSTYQMVFNKCATHMYLPDDVSQDYAALPIGLSDYDGRKLQRMSRQHGEFMLRQNKESIGLRAALQDLDEFHAIFANDRKNLQATLKPDSDGLLSG